MSAVEFGLASQTSFARRTPETHFEPAMTPWGAPRPRYEALSQFLRTIASSTIEEISGNIAELLQPIFGCEFASITLLDQATNEASPRSTVTATSDTPGLANSLWSACEEGKPVWIADWETDDHIPAHRGEQQAEAGHRWLCRLPLQTPHGCLGVLSVVIDQPDRSLADMQLLSLAADQIALGLVNSLLRAEVDKLRDGLDVESVYVESE